METVGFKEDPYNMAIGRQGRVVMEESLNFCTETVWRGHKRGNQGETELAVVSEFSEAELGWALLVMF